MKRLIALILVHCLLLCGCSTFSGIQTNTPKGGLGTDTSVYPVYENLTETEKDIWAQICTAIGNHSSQQITVGSYATQAQMDGAKERLNHLMRELAFSCPDYFWLNAYSFKFFTKSSDGYYELAIQPEYIMDQTEAAEKKTLYHEKINAIVANAQKQDDLFQKVLYVYDTIMAGATYDHDLAESDDTGDLGRTAYGCLVDGKTVCSGYALAFRSVMEKLGIECGVEFDSYSNHTLSNDGHVWNYCKLDGEYYYFDLTWDDTGFDGEDYKDILPYSHLYFGINAEELGASTYQIDPNAPTPDCNGTAFNYFIHQGMSFAEYDRDAVKPVLRAHKNDSFVMLRFDSYFQLEQAKIDLIDNQKIFDILPNLNNLSYVMCKSDRHLMLIF